MKVFIVGRGIPSPKYPMNGVFEFDQAKALAKENIDIVYLSVDLRSMRRIRNFGLHKKTIDGVTCYSVDFPVGRVGFKNLQFVGQHAFSILYKYAIKREGSCGLIHAHFYETAGFVKNVCLKYEIPLIITEHASDIHSCTDTNKIEIIKSIYNQSCVKEIIAVGESLKSDIQRISGKTAIVIGNIVDSNIFGLKNQPTKHSPFKFVSVGSLINRKGHDVLLDASNILINKMHLDIKLYICGEGPERDNLLRLIDKYRLNDKIEILGMKTREEISSILRDSDCFILASRGETFGVSFIEAMYCGLPVIGTKCGGPEYFIREQDGFVVEIDNVGQLVNAMCKIISSYEGFNAVEISNYVISNYSPECVAKKIYCEYLKITKTGDENAK